jgi:hypothetical protein
MTPFVRLEYGVVVTLVVLVVVMPPVKIAVPLERFVP